MRRWWPLGLVVVVFAAFFLTKGRGFLDRAPAETFSTPTSLPGDLVAPAPIALKGGKRACVDGVIYGPGAKYVQFVVQTKRPAGALKVEARAPGYAADATQPAGLGDNGTATVAIAPAKDDVGGGTLCVTNEGRHSLTILGVAADGILASPSRTTVDGRDSPADLSYTLLTSPSKSFGSRLGTMFSHMAALNPLSGWMVWVVFLLLMIGVPVGLGVALSRAAAEDDAVRR